MDNSKNIIYGKDGYAKIHYRDNCILNIHQKLVGELLILFNNMMYHNMDIVLCLSGPEGSGKSFAGRIIGAFFRWLINCELSVDDIHFDLMPYLNKSVKGKKCDINILDEAKDILDKKRSMSKSNKIFTDYMSKCRFKNQIHIIILPAIHDLDSRISLWRMNLLIHNLKLHYPDKTQLGGYKLQRGYFKAYGLDEELQKSINNHSKSGKYRLPEKYSFHGRFFDNEPFTDEQLKLYEEKKNESIKKIIDNLNDLELNKKESKFKGQRDNLIKYCVDNGLPLEQVSKISNLKENYIKQHIL